MQIENNLPEFEPVIFTDDDLIEKVDPVNVAVIDDNDNIDVENGLDTGAETTPTYSEDADPTAIATYEQLVEKGIVDKDGNFDGTWDSLESNIESLPQRVLNTLVSQAPDIAKDTVRFLFSSPNITQEELLNFVKTNQEELQATTVSIDTMDDAREYLNKVYQDRGTKPKQIEILLNALEEDETLMDEAKEEFEKNESLKKDKPKTEALIAAKENETLAANQARTEFTNNLFNELNNTGWKASKIDEIKNRIIKNEVNPILKEVFANPKAFVKMVDFIGYFKNGDIDYDKFISTLDTAKTKDYKNKIENAINSPTLSTKSNLKQTTKTLPDDAVPVLTFD